MSAVKVMILAGVVIVIIVSSQDPRRGLCVACHRCHHYLGNSHSCGCGSRTYDVPALQRDGAENPTPAAAAPTEPRSRITPTRATSRPVSRTCELTSPVRPTTLFDRGLGLMRTRAAQFVMAHRLEATVSPSS
uniref:Secreted protein n=1 Tax=Oryza sativa subsp. japonica TaxID=39947 RepID=Q7XIJ0_ORYSJ|nr:hypothetical protein [Oryza sativa Japonica Group]BAC83589.1 hypothetical protein [Oryza sativa Japonica Group]